MRLALLLPACIAAALLVAACGTSEQPHDDAHTPVTGSKVAEPQSAADGSFVGIGVLRSIVPNKRFVTISHQDIPGFMSAMTMPFSVRDSTILSDVAAGDSVEFTVIVEESGSAFLSRIEVR